MFEFFQLHASTKKIPAIPPSQHGELPACCIFVFVADFNVLLHSNTCFTYSCSTWMFEHVCDVRAEDDTRGFIHLMKGVSFSELALNLSLRCLQSVLVQDVIYTGVMKGAHTETGVTGDIWSPVVKPLKLEYLDVHRFCIKREIWILILILRLFNLVTGGFCWGGY